ncbi:hypothetical protein SAMN02745148_01377 [Modicisalibacter ilicicola DSM 19980]|uniref:Uncharacterized protein n=1 Tax=Modicisalibacter ilicicola DSM 19980 TaxID=1121942 RepID=A0A1M4X8X9_9GAMM|nr:hypothetical protein [Halomonas ilicicola]SHE89959.1 hypothetical protein SAMN02745148_01377 [Halomonas ilicicola DSM 19980]
MATPATPERLSVMAGVLVAILATLPRYLVNGHQGRLILILLAFVAVATVAFLSWRMLATEQRRRVPGLLTRLTIMLLLGGVLVALWQLFTSGLNELLLLSHGATLGLLLHALSMGWRQRGAWH